MTDPFEPSMYRVALLAGGRSGERSISLSSGDGASQALKEAGFSVERLDPAVKEDLKRLIEGGFDVAFLCTHGRYGEDGVLQGFLDLIDMPYTGSGVLASALAMNKAKAKLVYRDAGVPTPQSVHVMKTDTLDIPSIVREVGEHCVVKAASEGSTIGIYIVEHQEDLAAAVEKAFEHDTEVVVERFVAGREFTVAVLGNNDAHALPVIEIVPDGGFYDFEAKYTPGRSQHLCPAPLDEEVSSRMKRYAEKAHCALGCSGVSRTDFILDEEGGLWALETNTLPGMTATSLLPDAAKAEGVSFPELCSMLVKYALESKN